MSVVAENAAVANDHYLRPMHVDCDAVRIGAQQGTEWARASSRKLARAWMPLANILEDDADAVSWLPAHCSATAIGVRELSNGRKFDSVDLAANAFVSQLPAIFLIRKGIRKELITKAKEGIMRLVKKIKREIPLEST